MKAKTFSILYIGREELRVYKNDPNFRSVEGVKKETNDAHKAGKHPLCLNRKANNHFCY